VACCESDLMRAAVAICCRGRSS